MSQFMGSLNWASGLIPLGHHWATVLQGRHVLIATDNATVVAYINKQDPFQPPVAAGSGSVSVATDSGHNSKEPDTFQSA